MDDAIHKLLEEMLALSAQTRAFLAERLIESLDAVGDEGVSLAWRDEIGRRCREMDTGSVALRDADDAFADARSKLK